MAKTQIKIDSSVPFGTEFRAKSGNKSNIPNHFVVIGFDSEEYEAEEVIVYDITANDVKNIPMGLTPAGTWEIIRNTYSSRI
jgi:hypothetical protein